MPKPQKTAPPPSSWNSQIALLAWLATCVAVMAFLFFYRRGDILLYGDAVAHINIARRVFDSKTPGLLQLGTVWLPLPHLLMIPFIVSVNLWQRGAGGSIPSMAAYIFAVVGLFQVTGSALTPVQEKEPEVRIRVAAWIAAIIFAANPNLIYMQSTAMGESLYLAFFIWAVVYFADWMRNNDKALLKCGFCLAAACLTRYDGWFLAAVTGALVVGRALWARPEQSQKAVKRTRRVVVQFILIVAAAPALWLAYNGIVYRNPLEFANGPYSAKAIERRTQTPGSAGHPGSGNILVSAQFFVKAAEDNMAQSPWLGRAWMLLAFAAVVVAAALGRAAPRSPILLALVLLLMPLLFYALSVAHGGVPIFIPEWWPFTHYNVRYGLQLLPAFAFSAAVLANAALQIDSFGRRLPIACVLGLVSLTAASYTTVWSGTPICLKEAQLNMRGRTELEAELATWLEKLPTDSTVLMYLGDHVGAAERAGFPLARTINEGNHRTWRQPADPQGLWERALVHPSQYADFILAFEGDPVWQAVHTLHLTELVEIHVSGQARAVLYQAR